MADKFKGREFIAKSPKDGKWYGMDRVLRCPITSGCDTPEQAKTAWRMENARWAGDMATQSRNI